MVSTGPSSLRATIVGLFFGNQKKEDKKIAQNGGYVNGKFMKNKTGEVV